MASLNAKIGVYCWRIAKREKRLPLHRGTNLRDINLPKRLRSLPLGAISGSSGSPASSSPKRISVGPRRRSRSAAALPGPALARHKSPCGPNPSRNRPSTQELSRNCGVLCLFHWAGGHQEFIALRPDGSRLRCGSGEGHLFPRQAYSAENPSKR